MAKNITTIKLGNDTFTTRPIVICSTLPAVLNKQVSVPDFELYTGACLLIQFTAGLQTSLNTTLAINDNQPVSLYGDTAMAPNLLPGSIVEVVYTGAVFKIIGNTSADITGVTAGDGLTGGGATGAVTLNAALESTDTLTGDKTYPVGLNENGNLAVTVPWESGVASAKNVYYCTCSTEATGAMKVITCSETVNVTNGTVIFVSFTYGTTVAAAAIKVNDNNTTGCFYKGVTNTVSYWPAKTIIGFVFYAGVWNLIGDWEQHTYYTATCDTAAETKAKTITVDNRFQLVDGVRVFVKFTNGNSASGVTLNVNSTGEKNVYNYYGATLKMDANTRLEFVYWNEAWIVTSSSSMLTSGNVNAGYSPQVVNSETCGLGIGKGVSIASTSNGALFIRGSSTVNAINTTQGDIVCSNGNIKGNVVPETINVSSLSANKELTNYVSLVNYTFTSSSTTYGIVLPSSPINGQTVRFFKRNYSSKLIIRSSESNIYDFTTTTNVTLSPQNGHEVINFKGIVEAIFLQNYWYIKQY